MNPGEALAIGSAELISHGVRAVDDPATIRATRRTPGPVILLSMQGTATELAIDTTTAHPHHAVFAFVEAGGISAKEQHGPWVPLGNGLVIAPPGIDQRVQCDGAWRIIAAYVPRSALGAFVATLPATSRVLEERRPLDRAMQAFIEQVLTVDDDATAIERYAMEHLIVEMSGAILLDRVDTASPQRSPHAALRDRAIAVIAQQCGDPALNPDLVAREVQVSLRQLQLVFAEVENSVAGEIRHQRARRARSLLIDSRFDALSIEQVSQRSGFHSPISLRRALQEDYGATPRALRAHSGTGSQSDTGSRSGERETADR
ncbi:helix-turn-helix domain-containing protein [Microbacterium sp. STF-2]|uniref:helix-turn-helix domain-containing protein n=1 Tax=Microbacterium sp. STF-2 TaxID=3031132 RepID=UPI002AFF3963|nr:helix-turn-helix domain-containing protein [Microbacterium sp. STF-2]MEA1264551.1 helix-turn-helix domain-containing protein [Microbacterium sp. STF-2]